MGVAVPTPRSGALARRVFQGFHCQRDSCWASWSRAWAWSRMSLLGWASSREVRGPGGGCGNGYTACSQTLSGDVSDETWAVVAPYVTLMRPQTPQPAYDPREVDRAVRWMVRAGSPWWLLPTNFPGGRWWTSSVGAGSRPADSRRWCTTCGLLRWREGRADVPTAVILNARTAQSMTVAASRRLRPSTAGSAAGAGDDQTHRRRGAHRWPNRQRSIERCDRAVSTGHGPIGGSVSMSIVGRQNGATVPK